MKVSLRIRIFLFVLFFIVIGHQSFATHLRAGEITVVQDNCNSLTFHITVTVFINTKNTDVQFGGDVDVSYIYFGDGNGEQNRIYVPLQESIIRTDLDPSGGIAMASFTATHTYSSFGTYLIRYQEPNRNAGVLNMASSVTTLFYLETLINVDPFFGCSDSPVLNVPPIDKACTGVAWTHNPNAIDPDDGDSLSYEMVIPNSAKNVNVVNYRDPNNQSFYGANFPKGSEDGLREPTFDIDEQYGMITWDSPGKAGEYNIAFIVKEWRKIKGRWYMQGFVRRDMQIIVEDCQNERPRLEVPKELCVVAGKFINEAIVGTDPDAHDPKVLIQAYSEVFAPLNASPAWMVYSLPDSLLPKYENKPTNNVRFKWQTVCGHVRAQPYQVVFKITDNPPPGKGAKLATFESWTIRVVGPPPVWEPPTLNPGARSVQLKWEPYTCLNAEFIEVYRRVDSFAFTPDTCDTGIPENAGYRLIKILPVKNGNTPVTAYLDDDNGNGLAPGAKYCYRLVARFPEPRGGESLASEEVCVGPIEADAPIITNVSILKTNSTAGKIALAWMKPYDVDSTQFPGPYQYKVFRGEGFSGPLNATPVATVTKSPSTMQIFMTDSLNLNTEEKEYHYRIEAYANDGATFIDSSKMASSVRLEARSLLNKIELRWTAKVPWSNILDEDAANGVWAKHLIYRGPEGATVDQLVLIDSVDVKRGGQVFIDGDLIPLDNTKTYCYRILTRGSYGNPNIPSPLLNFSQTVCAQPGDSTAPCKPTPPVAMTPLSCEDYIAQFSTCDNKTFTNVITWERPLDPQCRNDIAYYNVYVSSTTTGEFTLLKTRITGNVYEDKNLPSFARCYKIEAVDRSGNLSEMSDAVCFDNCPYYELPNIFTPNVDECNGRFSAYSGNDRYLKGIDPETENPIYICGGVTDPTKCARFVERVVFRVYNRWGKEVYSYTGARSDEVNTIYIDWDGRADDGAELATGIYYYVAEVTFISVDPSQQLKTIKGWVQLMR